MRRQKGSRNFTILAAGFLLLLSGACDKQDISGPVPELITAEITDVTGFTAKGGGNIISDGGEPVTKIGMCWSTNKNVSIADRKTIEGFVSGSYISEITGLLPETTYYARAYATNSNGTGYGAVKSFRTKPGVLDIEGNGYNIVTIGSQTWMVENLRTTTYRDGTEISWVTNDIAWSKLETPGYTWYNNDSLSYKNPYGAYYNWYAVSTGKLCPQGWHVPADAEWDVLVDYLGGPDVAGGVLKEAGTAHWEDPNEGATNVTGFTALPGGQRDWSGLFAFLGKYEYWWSTEEVSVFPDNAWGRALYYTSTKFDRPGFSKKSGLGVRCLKD